MGCCLNSRPHTRLNKPEQFIIMIEREINELSNLLENEKHNITDWKKELAILVKSGLIELLEKINEDLDHINENETIDVKFLLEIFDHYFDIKENILFKIDEDQILNNDVHRRKINILYKDEFFSKLNRYLGYSLQESSESNSHLLLVYN